MARPVYSSAFIEAPGLEGDIDYEVPAGFRAVVRDISWFVGGGLTESGSFYVYESNGITSRTFDWFTVDVDTTVMHHQELRVVCGPGRHITAHADFESDCYIGGYLLSLP